MFHSAERAACGLRLTFCFSFADTILQQLWLLQALIALCSRVLGFSSPVDLGVPLLGKAPTIAGWLGV